MVHLSRLHATLHKHNSQLVSSSDHLLLLSLSIYVQRYSTFGRKQNEEFETSCSIFRQSTGESCFLPIYFLLPQIPFESLIPNIDSTTKLGSSKYLVSLFAPSILIRFNGKYKEKGKTQGKFPLWQETTLPIMGSLVARWTIDRWRLLVGFPFSFLIGTKVSF